MSSKPVFRNRAPSGNDRNQTADPVSDKKSTTPERWRGTEFGLPADGSLKLEVTTDLGESGIEIVRKNLIRVKAQPESLILVKARFISFGIFKRPQSIASYPSSPKLFVVFYHDS